MAESRFRGLSWLTRSLGASSTAQPKTGAAPGLEPHELTHLRIPRKFVGVTCIDYSPDQCQINEVTELADFLACHRPEWSVVRWINVDGLTDMETIRGLAEKYDLHPLAIEDVVHTRQRPKADDYPGTEGHPGRLFVVARMMILLPEDRLASEQISFFLGRNTLLTFQEMRRDVFNPVLQRLKTKDSRIRRNDVSFLLYSLLDTIVDHVFPVLEFYSERLDDMERVVLEQPTHESLQEVHRIKRDLILLRRSVWPLRELINVLQREPHVCLSDTTRTYLRDIYDHVVQIIDLVETYREFSVGLTETYMSTVSNRMNDIMKTLTIISTIFVPLTFLAGVYGMNMPIPENASAWTYPVFWMISLAVGGSMLFWFRKRGWF